jgi:hypothetical protein
MVMLATRFSVWMGKVLKRLEPRISELYQQVRSLYRLRRYQGIPVATLILNK